MQFLKIVSVVLMVAGFSIACTARFIVSKFGLDTNAACNFEHEMSEEELKKYKFDKTVVNFKMLGMLIALPGIILFLVAFR